MEKVGWRPSSILPFFGQIASRATKKERKEKKREQFFFSPIEEEILSNIGRSKG
jgi:hypothetical protein